jgi:hypothetical protein
MDAAMSENLILYILKRFQRLAAAFLSLVLIHMAMATHASDLAPSFASTSAHIVVRR